MRRTNRWLALLLTAILCLSLLPAQALADQPVSDWVPASDAPAGAEIVDTKWTYTQRSYTSSSSSSLSGWTQYDYSVSWSSWSDWLTWDPSNGSRNVDTRSVYDHTEYHYYRWISYSEKGMYTYKKNSSYVLEEKWFDHKLPTGVWGVQYDGRDKYYLTAWCEASYSGNYSVDKTFTRDIYRTEYCYQDPIYTYYYYQDTAQESTSDPSGWSDVSNVRKWVRYNTEPAHVHSLTKTSGKTATCTEDGYEAYWTCSDCGKLFSDAAGENEISAPVTVPKRGHSIELRGAREATCTAAGYSGDQVCTVCGETVASGETIKALGHDWSDWTITTPATEDADGVETRVCRRDGSHTETRVIPRLAHTYVVRYNVNGGTGTPSTQTKTEGLSLTLSDVTPTKSYTISYDANGGSVSPASKSVNCSFTGWNTRQNGSGDAYAPGGSYTADADVTLYAQWTDPTAGTLATPTRSGSSFTGWYTSASGGERVTESTTITGNTRIYAHWGNPYNLGDETYSFKNYGDSDSPNGHCFGMSMTSAGYYNGLLNISRIGGGPGTSLYSFSGTQNVKTPICYYQGIQGSYSRNAIVAGGTYYKTGRVDIAADWRAVVNYVKDHQFDGSGLLQIGIRRNSQGGHAINFLRYEVVDGQPRIYAYDNNFPNRETYFYQDSAGRVWQAPVQTFSGSLDCIALRDVRTYFNSVGSFDASRVLYMPKDAAIVQGYSYTYMESGLTDVEYVMYEIDSNEDAVKIIPVVDNADFIYMDTEYSFGAITDDTYGVLTFPTMDEGVLVEGASFSIFHEDTDLDADNDGSLTPNDPVTLIRASEQEDAARILRRLVGLPD